MVEETSFYDNNIITVDNISKNKSLGLKGENLIFLISQPRAGSTLIQKILSNHPKVHTTAEPWIMLHSVYALRSKGYEAEYNASWFKVALKDFLQTFPNGEEAYFEGLRRMHTYLYESALADSNKLYFLDKTPRYYHIIPELYRVFPKAHFIILLRNPLAVLCSIISSWIKKDWYKLHRFKSDLIQAPHLLINGSKLLNNQCSIVKYEDFLKNPEREIRIICERIGLNYIEKMSSYKINSIDNKYLGYKEQKKTFLMGKPDTSNLDKWMLEIQNAQTWRLVKDYLELLGKVTINQMGYDYEENREILNQNRPKWLKLKCTIPLNLLLPAGKIGTEFANFLGLKKH